MSNKIMVAAAKSGVQGLGSEAGKEALINAQTGEEVYLQPADAGLEPAKNIAAGDNPHAAEISNLPGKAENRASAAKNGQGWHSNSMQQSGISAVHPADAAGKAVLAGQTEAAALGGNTLLKILGGLAGAGLLGGLAAGGGSGSPGASGSTAVLREENNTSEAGLIPPQAVEAAVENKTGALEESASEDTGLKAAGQTTPSVSENGALLPQGDETPADTPENEETVAVTVRPSEPQSPPPALPEKGQAASVEEQAALQPENPAAGQQGEESGGQTAEPQPEAEAPAEQQQQPVETPTEVPAEQEKNPAEAAEETVADKPAEDGQEPQTSEESGQVKEPQPEAPTEQQQQPVEAPAEVPAEQEKNPAEAADVADKPAEDGQEPQTSEESGQVTEPQPEAETPAKQEPQPVEAPVEVPAEQEDNTAETPAEAPVENHEGQPTPEPDASGGKDEAENGAGGGGNAAPVGRLSDSGDYYIYEHPVYGKYVDAREFGTDTSGAADSLPAINAALAAAHAENAAVYLSGKLYISDQIVLNHTNSGVTALFGDGMGETTVSFDKAQKGVFNPNSNEDDIRAYAGILIDGQNGKTVAELSVEYTNGDFYRSGESYFGKVSGILVNDADDTLISKVEVSGANRAGVFFTSTQTLQKDPEGSGRTYKARLIRGEVDETYENLPVGENNRVVDSYLHHNRVAGVLFAYQKNFTADNNLFAWNGHEADGGTGYGIAAMAGSYNFGITFTNNTTDHNYRKGLDVHDGDDIVIKNNTLIGDRLYGIGVYNRQFTMDTVKITGNTIVQDPDFRLETDDNPKLNYHIYSAIQLQTNTQHKDLHSADYGSFDISGNTIKNLQVYKNSIQTYAIEFRNHEQKMDYTLNITDNVIEGESTKYLIAVINNTKDQAAGTNGPGSGTINIVGNKADIGAIASAAMPIYIEEKNTDGGLRGSVTLEGNHIKVREHSDGSIEAVQVIGNAEHYNIVGNTFELHGKMDKAMVSIHGRSSGDVPELTVTGNDIITDRTAPIYRGWIEYRNADVNAEGNTHNGEEIPVVKHSVAPVAETAAKAAVLGLDIGTDTVSSSSAKAAPLTKTAAAKAAELVAESENDDAPAAPALKDLLETAAPGFTAVLGGDSGAGFAVGNVTPEYAPVFEAREEAWHNETAAYIV